MKASTIMLHARTSSRIRRVRSQRPPRRGIAMLLVIISVMMATILTTAYMASRDNSAAIGSNAAAAAAARWTAESGLEIGIATLQTEAQWRTSHVGGRLVSNLAVAGGSVNIDLADIKTGLSPNASTEYVRVTSTGVVDGVSQVAVAEAHVPMSAGQLVDVDLSEFAVFASNRVAMSDEATVARWPMAPLTTLGRRVQVGTRATSASSITLTGDSASLDTTVYHGPSASASLINVATTQPPEKKGILDQIPMPGAPDSGVAPPPVVSAAPDLTQVSGSAITNVTTRWKNVSLSNTAIRMLRGNITAIMDEDLRVTNGGKLLIDGQVKVVVFGDVVIDGGAIELRPGARLTMFVRGRTADAMIIKDGFLGEQRATAIRDSSGKAAYMDPERLLVFSMTPDLLQPAPVWTVRDNSVIKASIYAPDVQAMTIRDSSALYGRVATNDLTLSQLSSVFYDPALDQRAGYTNPESAIYDGSGYIKNEVKSLTTLDGNLLQDVADSLGSIVLAISGSTRYEPTGYVDPDPVVTPPTDPTPRPIVVQARYITFGSALSSWE